MMEYEQQVRLLAYSLWQENPSNSSTSNWLEAEKQLQPLQCLSPTVEKKYGEGIDDHQQVFKMDQKKIIKKGQRQQQQQQQQNGIIKADSMEQEIKNIVLKLSLDEKDKNKLIEIFSNELFINNRDIIAYCNNSYYVPRPNYCALIFIICINKLKINITKKELSHKVNGVSETSIFRSIRIGQKMILDIYKRVFRE
jgi:hypothetical protein